MNPARIDASSDCGEAFQVLRHAARVEPAHRVGVEEFAGAEERGHDAIFAAEPRGSRDRYVHPRRSDAALRQAVDIRNRLRPSGIAHLHGCGGGRRRTSAHPRVQGGERRLYHVVVLGGEVDVVLELLTHQHVGRRVGGHEVRDRCRTGVDRRHLNGVVVGVRGAGNLPDPQPFVVGLPCEVIALPRASEEVGLGDDRQQRYPQVRAERGGVGCAGFVEDGASVERRGGAESRVDEEAVVRLGHRVDGVDVGGEEDGRLRLAQRDDALDAKVTQSAGAPGVLDEAADLGEDVVGEGVARVVQGRIALRVLAFQRHVDAEQARAAVDPYLLCRDGDVARSPRARFPDAPSSTPPARLCRHSHSATRPVRSR